MAVAVERLGRGGEEMGQIVARLGEDMRAERWTDVVLYSREGVPLPVHRLLLSQSTYLARLLTSLSCCQGRCCHQDTISVLLPDISYQVLLSLVNFLYTGNLRCNHSDKQHLVTLIELMGFGNIRVDTVDQDDGTEEEDQQDFDDDTLTNYNEDGNENVEDDYFSNNSSPSHSGGITSPEAERHQDFDEDSMSKSDSSEVLENNDTNDSLANIGCEGEVDFAPDPYQFLASPVATVRGQRRRAEKRKGRGSASSDTVQVQPARDKKYNVDAIAKKVNNEENDADCRGMEVGDDTLEPAILATLNDNTDDIDGPNSGDNNRDNNEDDEDDDSDITVPCSPRNCDEIEGL